MLLNGVLLFINSSQPLNQTEGEAAAIPENVFDLYALHNENKPARE